MKQLANKLSSIWQAWSAKAKIPAVLAAGLVLALIVWFWPTKLSEVVRFDGGGAWEKASAPPRRLIVWQPAESLDLPQTETAPNEDSVDESISPALADGGATLYFSRRRNGRPAEIVRSRLQNGKWTEPQNVAELNSPADDMGPIVAAGGKELYFFSNRPGGFGGYDLYVSTRQESGWSVPKNLGPGINTPANEYEPCLDPAGTVLYFSSNRTEQMAKKAKENSRKAGKDWSGTLRAETGERTYDLYRARRRGGEARWSESRPLVKLNRPESHEGSPMVSPDGAFFYFASDRPSRPDEEPNLDLYRARLAGGDIVGEAENLGGSINTSAHETEPALSPEGFRLVFSSNRDGVDRLYVSTATEVYEKTTRDTSRIKALANPWLWAGIVCGLLLLSALYFLFVYRRTLAEKVWPARFLAASLLINAVFVLLLFLWKLPGVVDAIVKHFEEPTPASRVVDARELQSQRTRENLYNKVADLPDVPTETPEWPNEQNQPRARQTNTQNRPADLPEDNSLPLAKNVPAELKTVVAVRSQPPAPRSTPEELVRQQPRQATAVPIAESIPELAASQPRPLQQPRESVAVEKLNSADKPSAVPPIPRETETKRPTSRPGSVPLSPLAKSATLPNASIQAKSPARQSLQEPALQQIARLDDAALKSVEKIQEEQIVPAKPAELARRAASAPAAPKSAKLQEDSASSHVKADLKKSTAAAKLNRPVPRPIDTGGTKTPDGLKKRPVAAQLAEVPELDALPEIQASAPAKDETEGRSQPENDSPAGPPRRTFAKAASPFPQKIESPKTGSESLAKSAEVRNLPPPSQPKLKRLAMKPSANPAELSQPAEVQEPAELTALLSLRNPDTRKEMAEVLGHHPAEEAAVKRGLRWLASHQNEDGSWSLHQFDKNCEDHPGRCSGTGSERSNTAATGLALLPFLASGYVPGSKGYGPVVTKGLDWLLANQDENGKLQGEGDRQIMYSHGIATIALCEAYGMTREPRLGEAAKKAVTFIVNAQHQNSGGWRYKPNEPGDTSVVGWQVMALKSAEMAGISVPASTYQNVRKWLKSVEDRRPVGGLFGYTNRNASPAMTAEGLLCLEFLSEPGNSPRLRQGVEHLLGHLPREDQRHTSYYWYYATQVLYHLQGPGWSAWNKPLQKLLVKTQEKNGHHKGTWKPHDKWEKRGGRIYTTALKLLMLEIEYRHLPLYGGLEPILKR